MFNIITKPFEHKKVNYKNQQEAEKYNIQGDALHADGNPAAAVECFKKAIDLNPQNANYYNSRGLSFYALGEFEQAIKDFDTAILLDSNKAEYYIDRGLALFAKGELEKAIADYSIALGISPKNAQAWSFRGIAYLMYAYDQNGRADIERALHCDGRCILALIGKALLGRCQVDDFEQANEYEQRVEVQLREQKLTKIQRQFRYYFYAQALQYAGEIKKAEEYYSHSLSLGAYKPAQIALDILGKGLAVSPANAEKSANDIDKLSESFIEYLNIDDRTAPSKVSKSQYSLIQTMEIKPETLNKKIKTQVEKECSFEEFIEAVKQGKVEQLRGLNFPGYYLTLRDQDGFNALQLAALKGHIAIAQFILLQNADVNSQNLRQNSALHLAAIAGKADMIALLLAFKADQRLKNNKGDVPLHLAVFNNHLNAVVMLLKAGSEIDATNNNNDTPLHYAALQGHQEIAELLLQQGADLTRVNLQVKTPAQLSLNSGNGAVGRHITNFYRNQCAALKALARKQDDLLLENERLTGVIAKQKVEIIKLSTALSEVKQIIQPRKLADESLAPQRRFSL